MQISLETLKRDITTEEVQNYLKNHPELEKWLMRKGENTKEKYIRHLIRYIETLYKNKIITEASPNGLLELARKQTEEEKPHVETLEEFQTSCEEILPEGKRAIVFNISITIKSFYNFKGYTFPRFRGSFNYSPKEKEKIPELSKIPYYLDIVKHIRTKTIIALETSAPIRMESLLSLKWKHFIEVLENKELPMIKLEASELKGKGRGKYSKIKQICFLSPFAKQYILRYKEWYEKTTNSKIELIPESLERPFLITEEGKPLTYSGLSNSFERAKEQGYEFRFHIWRTFVNEALMKVGMSKEHRDIMLGHKQPMVEKAYSLPNELREEFRKALEHLDPTFIRDERVEKVKQKIKDLKGIDISDTEAREILDTIVMKFFGSD
jgi:hypothetical protein